MKKLIVLFILIIVLFISSSQTYEQQSLIPLFEKLLSNRPLEELFQKVTIPYWGHTVSVDERGYYRFIEFIIRKSAHFFIFGFVALVIYSALPKRKFRFILTLLSTFILAVGDEYHQHLTGGRTPSWHDVVLDMSGALAILCTFALFNSILQKIRKASQ